MSTVFSSSTQAPSATAVRIEDITVDVRRNDAFDRHEKILLVTEAASGLEAIIAIHDTTLGPAMGGTRVWPYASRDEALTDVLRLSRGMTLKAAMAGTRTGGGKAVIIADSRTDKTEALLHAYGTAVEMLGGGFVTGEDVGLTVADADVIATRTAHIVGTSGRGGDPAPSTAFGVYMGIRAALRHRRGEASLDGVHVAVQGLGNVGRYLVELLARDRARLTVADINAKAALEVEKLFDATVVAPDEIYGVDADVFVPCALGGVVNDDTVPQFKVGIVAGSANNQLLKPRHGTALHEAGILFAPDYVINGGGLIALSLEIDGDGYTWPKARGLLTEIGATLDEIFARAAAEGLPPEQVADRIALERIRAARAATVAAE